MKIKIQATLTQCAEKLTPGGSAQSLLQKEFDHTLTVHELESLMNNGRFIIEHDLFTLRVGGGDGTRAKISDQTLVYNSLGRIASDERQVLQSLIHNGWEWVLTQHENRFRYKFPDSLGIPHKKPEMLFR